LGQLQLEVSKPNFSTWLSKTVGMECRDNRFVVGVPNTFVAEYLEKNQRSLIEKALTGILKDDVKVEFRVAAALKSAVLPAPTCRFSTPGTHSIHSWLVTPTTLPMQPPPRLWKIRDWLSTRCSFTAPPDWAKPTCSTLSATAQH